MKVTIWLTSLLGFLIQEESVKAVFFISFIYGFGSYKSFFFGPLVRVLENGNDVGRERGVRKVFEEINSEFREFLVWLCS